MADEESVAYLKNIARDIQSIRSELIEVTKYMKEAESEVPEKMRRFIMYFHDVHDIINLYHELGQEAPKWMKNEVERCDDRFRHLVEDLNKEMGAFERVRQEMSKRPGNRWDHSRLLPKQEKVNETGNGKDNSLGDQSGTSVAAGKPGSGVGDRSSTDSNPLSADVRRPRIEGPNGGVDQP